MKVAPSLLQTASDLRKILFGNLPKYSCVGQIKLHTPSSIRHFFLSGLPMLLQYNLITVYTKVLLQMGYTQHFYLGLYKSCSFIYCRVSPSNEMIPFLYFSVSLKFGAFWVTDQWGQVQNKERYVMLSYTFLVFWQICDFIMFIFLIDKVSNFRKRILTNPKKELMVRNCQWNCMSNSSYNFLSPSERFYGTIESFACDESFYCEKGSYIYNVDIHKKLPIFRPRFASTKIDNRSIV